MALFTRYVIELGFNAKPKFVQMFKNLHPNEQMMEGSRLKRSFFLSKR